jgi:FkbM family methyltransferase
LPLFRRMKNAYFILRFKQYLRSVKLQVLLWRNVFQLFSIIHKSSWGSFYVPYFWVRPHQLIPIKIKSLNNHLIFIRRGSLIDRDVIQYVFYHQYHLPLNPLPAKSVILDLGANIGCTVCHFNHLYPDATIIGYELDKANYEVALKNIQSFKKCYINNQAVWGLKRTAYYNHQHHFDAYHVNEQLRSGKQVSTITINDILDSYRLEKVDYLKMDIEGAEKNILLAGDTSWLHRVQGELNIEMHEKDIVQQYMDVITGYGFRCYIDKKHPNQLRAVRLG